MEQYSPPSSAAIFLQRVGAVAALCSITIGLSAELTAEASTAAARNKQDYHQAQSDYLGALQSLAPEQYTNLEDLLNPAITAVTGDSPTSIPAMVVPQQKYPVFNLGAPMDHSEISSPQTPRINDNPEPKIPKFNLSHPAVSEQAPATVMETTPQVPHFSSLESIDPQATQAAPTPTTVIAPPTSIQASEQATSLPQGDTKTLAKQVLENPNITFQVPAEKVAFQHIAETGHAVECGAAEISAKLEGVILKLALANKYKFVIGVVTDGHECDKFEHPKGRAVDINGINPINGSTGGTGNYISDKANDYTKPLVRQFYKDAGEILAANGGGALAQQSCFITNIAEITVGGVFYYDKDSCDHIHIDVGTSNAARAEPRTSPVPQPVAPTAPPANPVLPSVGGSSPRKFPSFNLAPAVIDPIDPDPKQSTLPTVPKFELTPTESPAPPAADTPAGPATIVPKLPESTPQTATEAPAAPTPAPVHVAPQPPSAPEAQASADQISVEKAIRMLPGANPQTVRDMYPMMIAALKEVGIDDFQMVRYTFATISSETATCLPIKEMGGKDYLESKEYFPYFGRGYIQLTWNYNYKAAGLALGLDLTHNPDLALDPQNAVRILAWYMKGHEARIRVSLSSGDLEGARAVVNGRNDDGHPNGMTEFNRSWKLGA